MMYWTVLWITVLGGPLDGTQSGIVFRSEAECEAARPAAYEMVKDQYDAILDCEPSDLPSGSIRPKRRPGA